MPQLYVVGFLSGTLSVIFDLSWNTLFVAVTKRDRYVEAHGAAQRQPVARVGRRTDHRRPPGPGPRRAAGDARRRDLVPGIGRLPAPDQGARTADRARGRLDPRTAAGRACRSWSAIRSCARRCSRWPTVNLFTFASSALFILYATTTLGVSPGALGLALGVGSVGAVIGAIVASRIGRRIGLGPAYALGLLIFPASLLLIPLADAGHVDGADPRPAAGLRVRRRASA